MKKITTLITLLILVGCNSMQTNIEVDSVDTFNLGNYSDFSIKINESSISAEINPIDLERFKDNLKTSLIAINRPPIKSVINIVLKNLVTLI